MNMGQWIEVFEDTVVQDEINRICVILDRGNPIDLGLQYYADLLDGLVRCCAVAASASDFRRERAAKT